MASFWSRATGFSSWQQYLSGLITTPRRLRKQAFHRVTAKQQLGETAEECGAEMKKVLGAVDLVMLGIGMMLGAGVFVTTGQVAVHTAGPAVVVSYLVAGVSALLSSLCYAEFSSNMPLSGGAYSYISAVFGELLAWITVANLIFEYILANAACIRGFTPYFAMLTNEPPSRYLTAFAGYELDWFACAWVLLITVLLILGTKESSTVNIVMSVVHLLLVAFIVIAGFTRADPANAQPFLPYGVEGIFEGASIVFYSFIGFDTVATSAEEVKRPGRDLPLGILGALGVVTVFYVLMSLALVMMVPIGAIDDKAAFAAAFSYVGMSWAKYIVAAGAILGILTSTLASTFAQSRIIAAVGRQHLLPPVLALVHPKFGTPYVATILSGVATAVIALFTDFAHLVDLVSISTLFAFWMVGLALIWHRYYKSGVSSPGQALLIGLHLALLIAASITFTVCYYLYASNWIPLVVSSAAALAVPASLRYFGRAVQQPASYSVPLFPFVPAISVVLNTFLLGQLGRMAYIRFGYYTLGVLIVYVFYSMHASSEIAANSLPNLPQLSVVSDDQIHPSSAAAAVGVKYHDDESCVTNNVTSVTPSASQIELPGSSSVRRGE